MIKHIQTRALRKENTVHFYGSNWIDNIIETDMKQRSFKLDPMHRLETTSPLSLTFRINMRQPSYQRVHQC